MGVFCLGALQSVDTRERDPQVLFLSPTRELAEQSQKVCLALGDYLNVQVHCCIGGRRVSDDIHTFEAGVHIVSGTPGRVFHMILMRMAEDIFSSFYYAAQKSPRTLFFQVDFIEHHTLPIGPKNSSVTT